mgnify:CR=1 FL=1
MRIHCPTADDSPLLAHAVDVSPSNAAAGELAGDVWPGWVASDAEPDVDVPIVHEDTEERLLTGADLDVESLALATDRTGEHVLPKE